MRDALSLLLWTALTVIAVPNLWLLCDRRATRSRSATRAVDPATTRVIPVTGIEALTAIARALRAGSESTAAVIGAPPCPGLTATRDLLTSGMQLAGALDTGTPESDVLLSCLHHGQFSPAAVEHAVHDLLREAEFRRETQAALSGARASARVLTVLPFGFLAVALLFSAGVRNGTGSPTGIAVLTVGVLLNRAGARWMKRSAERALRAGDAHIALTSTATFVAHHLHAGGDVQSAFTLLSRRRAELAEAAARMGDGEPLRAALEPVARSMPGLANAILTAHRDGLPLEPQLLGVAREALHRRTQEVRAAVSRLPARTTVPLVACVLPSFVLVALMPLVLATSGGQHPMIP